MLFGVLLYVGYRRRQQLPLEQTVKVVTPEPLGVEEVEYKSVLVAFEASPFSEEAVATAARLAARRRRGIHVLRGRAGSHGTCRSTRRSSARRRRRNSKIERAKLIGGLRVTGHVERVRPGQAGQAIVDEARSDQGGGDRHAAALPERQAAVRQDAADGAGEAARRVIVAAQPGEKQPVVA